MITGRGAFPAVVARPGMRPVTTNEEQNVTSATAAAGAVGPPPGMKVRLSSNESPLGPSSAAVEAAARVLAEGHRYPDDQSLALRGALAAHDSVGVDQVAVGTGSTALIMDAVAHASRTGGHVLAFEQSFVVYRLAAANAGLGYREVVASPAEHADEPVQRAVEALLDAIDPDTCVIAVDNPGNPTGAHLSGEQLAALVAAVPAEVTIIVDEAYHEFAAGERGYATVAELGLDHPGLLVLRTFSKAHALAGLRVGWMTGPPSLVGAIDGRRSRFNVSAPAQAAAIASLADRDHLTAGVKMVREGRARMADGLRARGVRFADGLGNFLTLEFDTDAADVIDRYAALGVGVRSLAPYGMGRHVRVTVGTPAEVDAFLEATTTVVGETVTS